MSGGSHKRAGHLNRSEWWTLICHGGIVGMVRTLRRAGMVAALCLIASTAVGTASAAPQADPVQTFQNGLGGCLDYNNNDGARSYPCNGGAWQQWRVHVWGDSTRQFQNVATGKCLTFNPLGGDVIDGFDCSASTIESWFVVPQSNGGIAFRNQETGECLYHGSGYSLHQTSCDAGDPGQTWR